MVKRLGARATVASAMMSSISQWNLPSQHPGLELTEAPQEVARPRRRSNIHQTAFC